MSANPLMGKYRGKVVNTQDPLKLGRIQAQVPNVFGEDVTHWAMPCVAYAGKDVGYFALPPIGGNIWVEFEGGDPEHPIWTGCFWGEGELPPEAVSDKTKVFKTEGIILVLDNEKGITLDVKSPAVKTPLKMIFNSSGIEINSGNVDIKLISKPVSVELVGAKTIELKNSSTNIKMDSSKIEIKGTAGIELKNGGASIKMDAVKVNVNNGALEVM